MFLCVSILYLINVYLGHICIDQLAFSSSSSLNTCNILIKKITKTRTYPNEYSISKAVFRWCNLIKCDVYKSEKCNSHPCKAFTWRAQWEELIWSPKTVSCGGSCVKAIDLFRISPSGSQTACGSGWTAPWAPRSGFYCHRVHKI